MGWTYYERILMGIGEAIVIAIVGPASWHILSMLREWKDKK